MLVSAIALRCRFAAVVLLLGGLLTACATAPIPDHSNRFRELSPGVEVGPVVVDRGKRSVLLRIESNGATLAGTLHLPDGPGPHPAVMFVHGSGARRRLASGSARVKDFVRNGYAVYTYDKRGVGDSTGICCPVHFDLLAEDAASGIRALRDLTAIDADRIGMLGVSQAGWVVPIAASKIPDISFAIVLSGPTVTLGEESLYSALTADRGCGRDGLSISAADEEVRRFGPSGFDPRPYLEAMPQPVLWLYGANDIHQPANLSVRVLEDLRAEGKDFTVRVFPRANHFLARGGPCDVRPVVDWMPVAFDWLDARLGPIETQAP